MTERHRFVVLGSGGRFTRQVIKTLFLHACYPLAYIQSGTAAKPPGRSFAGIDLEIQYPADELQELLQSRHIPCYFKPGLELENLLLGLNADFMLVACWPGLLSPRVLGAVRHAALNLHPSQLPAYRGPRPIAEQLAAGERDFGITLHLMNDRFDCGDIVLQEILAVNETTLAGVENRTASRGAELFMQALQTFHAPGWKLKPQ